MENEGVMTCPFCGCGVMCGSGQDARELCGCVGAWVWRKKNDTYRERSAALFALCGEDCADIDPHYKPVGDEILALLDEVLRRVCFGDISRVSLVLADSSALTLSEGAVRRVAKIDTKM